MSNLGNSTHSDIAAAVLRQYGTVYEAQEIRAIGNAGGFSGSEIWRCKTRSGEYCLKRWPITTELKKLTAIHAVLRSVHGNGFTIIPVPIVNQHAVSITSFQDALWDLTPWLEGEPLLHGAPTAEQLSQALQQLAQFHLASAKYHPPTTARSAGLQRRRDEVQLWRTVGLKNVQQAIRDFRWKEFEERSRSAIDLFRNTAESLELELNAASDLEIPVQFCIRDIRAEHVLFNGDKVTGIIDFGAMRIESPAGDIARLVGTTGELANKWQIAVETYSKKRALSDVELRLIPVFYRSGVILGALNWIEWIVVEKRVFENSSSVLDRLDTLLRQWREM